MTLQLRAVPERSTMGGIFATVKLMTMERRIALGYFKAAARRRIRAHPLMPKPTSSERA